MLILEKTPAQKLSKRLVSIKYTQFIIDDLKKLQEFDEVHKLSTKESYLLETYIINLVANWQVFIEDLLEYGINKTADLTKNERLKTIILITLKEKLKRFNTPNTENIDSYFNDILAISKISSKLSDSDRKKTTINEIVKIRHNIAHKGFSDKELTVEKNFNYMETLFSVAKELEDIVQTSITS